MTHLPSLLASTGVFERGVWHALCQGPPAAPSPCGPRLRVCLPISVCFCPYRFSHCFPAFHFAHLSPSAINATVCSRSAGRGTSIKMVPLYSCESLCSMCWCSAFSMRCGSAVVGSSSVRASSSSRRTRMCDVSEKVHLRATISRSHPVIFACAPRSKCASMRSASVERCHPAKPCITTDTPYTLYACSLCASDAWGDLKNRPCAFIAVLPSARRWAISDVVRWPPSTMLPRYLNCGTYARMQGSHPPTHTLITCHCW